MNILVVSNDNSRNELFLEMFKGFNAQGYGKLTDSYYIIDSNITTSKNSKAEIGFNMINQRSNRQGFIYTMWIIE